MLNLRQSRQTIVLHKRFYGDHFVHQTFGMPKLCVGKIWMSSKQVLNHHILGAGHRRHPNYFSFFLTREKYFFVVVLEVARVIDFNMVQLLSQKKFLSDGTNIFARLVTIEAPS
jgi:hypothetical protein